MTTKIGEKFRVTLPPNVREQFHLAIGDPLEVVLTDEGIMLKPKKLVDASQAYFWTPEWQAKEHQVSEDFKKGRVDSAKEAKEFFRKLNA